MTNAPRPRMLLLTLIPVASGPRVLRQVHAFSADYQITTVGYGPPVADDVAHIRLSDRELSGVTGRVLRVLFAFLLLLRLHRWGHAVHPKVRAARRALRGTSWDVVIAHDPMASRIAIETAAGARLVDLYEYAPSQGEDRRVWRWTIGPLYTWLCRRWVARADASFTVAPGIAAEYERRFGFCPEVITNATDYAELTPGPTGSPLRLVHSGVAAAARRLEIMIDAVRGSDLDVTLDLLLVDNGSGYLHRLRERAGGDPRIIFRAPVPYRQLVPRLNEYDVGLAVIAPTTFNLMHCLPNKFFDFVQARLAIVTGPSPEMSRLVMDRGLGLVTEGFDAASLRDALAELTPLRVDVFKRASDDSARDLSGEEQQRRLVELVTRVRSRAER